MRRCSWRVPERVAERVAGVGAQNGENEQARVPDVGQDDLGLAGVTIPLERDRVTSVLAGVQLHEHEPTPFWLRSSPLREAGDLGWRHRRGASWFGMRRLTAVSVGVCRVRDQPGAAAARGEAE